MRSREPAIERVYQVNEELCIRALELLVKKSRKEGGAAITAPNDTVPSDTVMYAASVAEFCRPRRRRTSAWRSTSESRSSS